MESTVKLKKSMELIKELGIRINNNGHKIKWGEFLCPACLNKVERILSDGKKQKTCCKKYKFPKNSKLNYKHGMKKTRLYNIWHGIKSRILNKNNKDYKNYGGRGLTVCADWLEFIPFRDWALSNGYAEHLTIDRRNNNGNYTPENCHWIHLEKNAQKKRTTKINLEIANKIRELHKTGDYTQISLSKKFGISPQTISLIILYKIWKNDK